MGLPPKPEPTMIPWMLVFVNLRVIGRISSAVSATSRPSSARARPTAIAERGDRLAVSKSIATKTGGAVRGVS